MSRTLYHCDYAGGEDFMNAEDLYENLLRQKINVMDGLKRANYNPNG